jgi:hypothetical protein
MISVAYIQRSWWFRDVLGWFRTFQGRRLMTLARGHPWAQLQSARSHRIASYAARRGAARRAILRGARSQTPSEASTMNLSFSLRRTCLKREKVLGWPKRFELAHALRWECSYRRLRLAQLLGRHGVDLTPW